MVEPNVNNGSITNGIECISNLVNVSSNASIDDRTDIIEVPNVRNIHSSWLQ